MQPRNKAQVLIFLPGKVIFCLFLSKKGKNGTRHFQTITYLLTYLINCVDEGHAS